MTLFNKNATAGYAPAYDVKPASPSMFSGGLWAPIAFVKNAAQGACAGLLTFLGAMHMTVGFDAEHANGDALAALTNIDAATLNSVAENLLDGGIPGVIEIIAAAVLFLNAGRGWAKVLGLLGFIAIAFAHANGVSHAEMFEQMTDLYETIQSTVTKFQTASAANLAR